MARKLTRNYVCSAVNILCLTFYPTEMGMVPPLKRITGVGKKQQLSLKCANQANNLSRKKKITGDFEVTAGEQARIKLKCN